MWSPQWRNLTRRFRVLRYDMRGHGKTEATEPPYDMEMLADDLAALAAATGFDRAHIVGLSIGGMVAQVYGTKFPEQVASLCLIATTAVRPSGGTEIWDRRIAVVTKEGRLDGLIDGVHDRWLSMRFRRQSPEHVDSITKMILSTPVKGYIGCCCARRDFDWRNRLEEIAAPTLILAAEEDSGTTVEDAELISAGIRGASLEVTEHARHLLNWETPQDILERIADWVTSNEASMT